MKQERKGSTVILQELTPKGLSPDKKIFIKFSDGDRFLNRRAGTISGALRKYKIPVVYDISRPQKVYAITTVDGEEKMTRALLVRFYARHTWPDGKKYTPYKPELVTFKKLSAEQIKTRKVKSEQRFKLLKAIDDKYGGISAAEGSKELEELRVLLGVYD